MNMNEKFINGFPFKEGLYWVKNPSGNPLIYQIYQASKTTWMFRPNAGNYPYDYVFNPEENFVFGPINGPNF